MLEDGEDKGSKAAARAEGGREGEQRMREKPGGGEKR